MRNPSVVRNMLVLGGLLITLPFGWVLAQATPGRGTQSQGSAGVRAYVANETSGTVAVINTATNIVETIVCLGSDPAIANTPQPNGPCNAESDHHRPFYDGHVGAHGLWLTPDGRVLLVANRISGTVAAIDTAAIGPNPPPILSPVPEGLVPGYQPTGREPHLATVRPGGTEAWVAVRGEEHVDVLDLDYRRLFDDSRRRTDRMRLNQTIDTMDGPSMVSFTSDGKTAFIAAGKAPLVYKIQADSGHILAIQALPPNLAFTPFGLVSPDDKELYLIHKNQGGKGRLSILRTDDLSYVVDANGVPVNGKEIGPCANHVYFVGSLAYITIGGDPPCAPQATPPPPTRAGKIVIIDRITHFVARELTAPDFDVTGDPHGIWGTPDGRKLFIGHESGNRVSVIDTGNPNDPRDDRDGGIVSATAAQQNFMKQPIDVVVTRAGPGTPGFADAGMTSAGASPANRPTALTPVATATATAPPVTTTPQPSTTPTGRAESPAHEIAVTRLSAPSMLAQGSPASITVEVENQGNNPETFTMAVTQMSGSRTVLIGSQEVATLPAGQKATLTQSWQTSAQDAPGQYLLSASVSQLANEPNLANNRRSVPITLMAKT